MNNLLRLLVIGGLGACAVVFIALGMAQNNAALLAPVHLLLFLVVTAVYLLPVALAVYRDCKSALWIGLIDVFPGWTVIGWFAALGWAAGGKVRVIPPRLAPPANPVLRAH